MKICMFVKNSFEYDARVTKEARSLIAAGHDVTVVAIHVPEATAARETRPDGIRVIRVSRMHFGLGALSKFAAKYAGSIEQRHSRLTGEPVDIAKAEELARIVPASTATPGADRTAPTVPQPAAAPPSADPSTSRRIWAAVTTPLLRGVAHLARFGFRVAKAVLGRQGLALKTWAINRRMIGVGLETGADVFHSHDLNTLYIGAMCKRRTGKPLVYDSHELATERNRMTYWWRRWATWNERRWIREADSIIVASPSWGPWLRDKYPGLDQPITEIINVPPYEEVVPRDLRGALDIPADEPVLLYQGSIQENRGIEQAIEATLLLDRGVMVVVGYGYHRPTLEKMVRERGIGDRVKFFGPIPNEELVAWTAGADIGMANIINSSVSYYTSLPNKLFEYIMAGVAVIGSDSPEIGRIVRETGVGEVADPADPEALAEAARKILADLDSYRRRTRAAAERYNWSVEERKLLAVYEPFTT